MPLFDRKQAGRGSFASADQRPTHILNEWSLTAVANAEAVVPLSTGRGHSSPLPRRHERAAADRDHRPKATFPLPTTKRRSSLRPDHLNEWVFTRAASRKRTVCNTTTSRHSCADKRTTEEVVQLSPTLRYPSAIAVAVST